MIQHPQYSPDLSPCDFWLFPKVKYRLRGKSFSSIDELKSEFEKKINSLTPNDFKKCFLEWIKRCKKIIKKKGEYY